MGKAETRIITLLWTALACAALLLTAFSSRPPEVIATPAPYTTASVSVTAFERPAVKAKPMTISERDNLALDWAETQGGKPYEWGGTGPSGYDCSGLVQTAFRHEGVSLPRTTYEMLASPDLIRVSAPQRGDLVFFDDSHVEFDTVWPHTTFGAHSQGSRIGWLWWGWSGRWPPGTMFFEVR
jgi:cell wall-associated NlpC family hydrolase